MKIIEVVSNQFTFSVIIYSKIIKLNINKNIFLEM